MKKKAIAAIFLVLSVIVAASIRILIGYIENKSLIPGSLEIYHPSEWNLDINGENYNGVIDIFYSHESLINAGPEEEKPFKRIIFKHLRHENISRIINREISSQDPMMAAMIDEAERQIREKIENEAPNYNVIDVITNHRFSELYFDSGEDIVAVQMPCMRERGGRCRVTMFDLCFDFEMKVTLERDNSCGTKCALIDDWYGYKKGWEPRRYAELRTLYSHCLFFDENDVNLPEFDENRFDIHRARNMQGAQLRYFLDQDEFGKAFQ